MKDLCFITMVRRDYDFLRIWIKHHATLVGVLSDLVVVSHGHDPKIDEIANGCSLIKLPDDEHPPSFELSRREMFFGLVRAMSPYYKFVVIGDVDELIVLDPRVSMSLGSYLCSVAFKSNVLTVCNFNIVHNKEVEPNDIDLSVPILTQRRHGSIAGGYCKPMIFKGPVGSSEGCNSHKVLGQDFQLDRNIICFHLCYFDWELSSDIARKKAERTAELDDISTEENHIGSWRRGERRVKKVALNIQLAEPFGWDSPEVDKFFRRVEKVGSRKGFLRVHHEWFPHVILPDRFKGIF